MLTYHEFKTQTELASRIANQAHENQKYGTLPYQVHLEAVVKVLERFGFKVSEDNFNEAVAQLLIAAWLHDVLEDTVLQANHLVYHFGEVVTDLVKRVTDEPGRNRKEKKLATYPKIRENYYALVLKLADRIANVEAAINLKAQGSHNLYQMYHKEYAQFKHYLYQAGQGDKIAAMWQQLDQLLNS